MINLIEWIAYFAAIRVVFPFWWRLVRQEFNVRTVGGLTFFRHGRFGGSWYVSRRT